VADLEPRLTSLVRRELLRRQMDPRSPERGQYEFVQALIREVAYNTLSKKDRKKLHLAAARYFESMGGDEIAGALATHYLAAHANASEPAEQEALATQARIALKAAAARAESLGSFTQAASFLGQALAVTDDPVEQANLLLQAGTDERIAGDHEAAEGHFRRAISMAADANADAVQARATAALARLLIRATRPQEARDLLEPALVELASVGEEPVTRLQLHYARALSSLGEGARSSALLEEVLDSAERHGYIDVIVDGLHLKANWLWNAFRRREAFAVVEGARKLAEENAMTDDLIEIMSALANAASEFDAEEGVVAMREVMAIARRTGRRDSLMAATANFGYHAFIAGLWDEALAELEATMPEDMAPGHRGVMLNNWADIKACRGENVDEAISELERLEQGRGRRASVFRLDTQQLAQAARGDFKGASKTYESSLELSPGDANEVTYRCGRWELWAGDVDEARRLHASFVETGAYGPLVEARRQTLEAGIAASEGRTSDAIALYRDALKNWRDTHSGWDEALTGIDMAMLLDPSDPEVAAVIKSTREILERLRAKPYLELLDRAVANYSETHSSPSLPAEPKMEPATTTI